MVRAHRISDAHLNLRVPVGNAVLDHSPRVGVMAPVWFNMATKKGQDLSLASVSKKIKIINQACDVAYEILVPGG